MSDPFQAAIEAAKKRAAQDAADKQLPSANSPEGGAAYNPPGGKADPNDPYSKAAADLQAKNRVGVTGDTHSDYINPGSADYGGGPGMAKEYSDIAADHITDNDAQQASNAGALDTSVANMKGNRGPQAVENAALSNREAAARGEQGKMLDLSMKAAMGQAPSEAAYNQKLAMNKIGSGLAGMQGQARGLSALTSAQGVGGAQAGELAGEEAFKSGMGRSKEIGNAIGMYGSQAGQVRGQDLTRLGMSNQNNLFNTGLNNEWKVGNANLAAAQGGLGVSQDQMDQQWFGEYMKPTDIQFQLDQGMAAQEAGANLDTAAAAKAKDNQNRQNTQAVVGGITQAGLTAVGSLAGPAGAAAGGMAGTAINSATKKYY